MPASPRAAPSLRSREARRARRRAARAGRRAAPAALLPARSHSSPTGPLLADDHPGPPPLAAARANAAQPAPEGTMFAPTWQSAVRPAVVRRGRRTGPGRVAPRPRGRRARRAPRRRSRGSRPGAARTPGARFSIRCESMARVPIHLRAEPGDYAEACLLPGDPLRAKYIAETFFDDARQVNGERGMLGFTGTFQRPVRCPCRRAAWAARRRRS